MKCFVVDPFTLETSQGSINLEAGKILELSQEQAERLGAKVEPFDDGPFPFDDSDVPAVRTDGRELAHFCAKATGWCSVKLPGGNYPADCERVQCSHRHNKRNNNQLKSINKWSPER